MGIRPIRTEADYEAALAEIEHLFDATPNTPEGDRLDVLTTLVEAYEAHYYPISEPDPVEAISTTWKVGGCRGPTWSLHRRQRARGRSAHR